jgi:hypothetical protein
MADTVESMARRFALLAPHLTELQQRLWLGVEASELGSGGVGVVAEAVSVATDTVRRGRAEALGVALEVPARGRSRRPGGGRKRAEAHDADLVAALELLIEPTTRGDPGSPLRWTTLSTRNLAKALTDQGHRVSEFVVRRLLKQLGYSLQANAKDLEGKQHPDRDAQFRYLAEQSTGYLDAGDPVISIDTKKKELVGQFRNGGQELSPKGEPEKVNVHDFPDKELGKVSPYGVYDIAADDALVSVGTDHDTAQFAVASIGRWWNLIGKTRYPDTSKLLISADGGGSNGSRVRLFKVELAKLAATTGLTITVCHLPPGTSKWNKIEHRLFCFISMNWRGRPLTSHEVIISTINATTNAAGLHVRAELDTDPYPTGIQIPPEAIKTLETTGILVRHDFHGEWNYTVHPAKPDTPAKA